MNRYSLALVITLLPSIAAADTVLGLYAGIGQWYINLEGDVGQNGSTTTLDDLGFENETSNVLWVMVEHPIPVIPNIRLMHSSISATEESTTTQRFTIGGIPIEAEIDVLTDIDLSHTDATFYYELMDNWLTVDLGLTARHMSGFMEVQSEVTRPARAELDGVLPLAYLNLQLDFPYSGWSIGATGHGVAYRGDKLTDFAVRLGYSFEVTALLDLGINVGYRELDLLAEELDDLYADATISGAFAEFVVHF